MFFIWGDKSLHSYRDTWHPDILNSIGELRQNALSHLPHEHQMQLDTKSPLTSVTTLKVEKVPMHGLPTSFFDFLCGGKHVYQ